MLNCPPELSSRCSSRHRARARHEAPTAPGADRLPRDRRVRTLREGLLAAVRVVAGSVSRDGSPPMARFLDLASGRSGVFRCHLVAPRRLRRRRREGARDRAVRSRDIRARRRDRVLRSHVIETIHPRTTRCVATASPQTPTTPVVDPSTVRPMHSPRAQSSKPEPRRTES